MTGRFDVVIIGAGISGLMAARRLTESGKSVVVLDKGVSPGGRLATRRIGAGKADHGAQFFTVRASLFQAHVEEWLNRGWVFEWSRGWAGGSLAVGPTDGYPRYAARDGFNRLAKHLATGLEIRLATHIREVKRTGTWLAVDINGNRFESDLLVMAAPVPQSLALLSAGGVELDQPVREKLETISYAPCLCGLFLIDDESQLPSPGARQQPDQPVSWIADNQRKGISPGATVITLHTNPLTSRLKWIDDDKAIIYWMKDELRPYLVPGSEILESQLKRWRYALPEKLYPDRFLSVQEPGKVYFCGDAFGGPRVEGAVLSGLAAAEAIAGLD